MQGKLHAISVKDTSESFSNNQFHSETFVKIVQTSDYEQYEMLQNKKYFTTFSK